MFKSSTGSSYRIRGRCTRAVHVWSEMHADKRSSSSWITDREERRVSQLRVSLSWRWQRRSLYVLSLSLYVSLSPASYLDITSIFPPTVVFNTLIIVDCKSIVSEKLSIRTLHSFSSTPRWPTKKVTSLRNNWLSAQ